MMLNWLPLEQTGILYWVSLIDYTFSGTYNFSDSRVQDKFYN